jgi:hypothetical protein
MLSGAAASPSRASDIPTPPPKAVHALAGASRSRHYGGAQGNPSEVRDCHQSEQSVLRRLLLAADLRVCAPGRTRTCTLRIRSETRPIGLVLPESIATGRVRFAVCLVVSWVALLRRPDCQRDCQCHHGLAFGQLSGGSPGAHMHSSGTWGLSVRVMRLRLREHASPRAKIGARDPRRLVRGGSGRSRATGPGRG